MTKLVHVAIADKKHFSKTTGPCGTYLRQSLNSCNKPSTTYSTLRKRSGTESGTLNNYLEEEIHANSLLSFNTQTSENKLMISDHVRKTTKESIQTSTEKTNIDNATIIYDGTV